MEHNTCVFCLKTQQNSARTGPSVTSNGTLVVAPATRQLYAQLTQPEVALKLSPVMLPLSPDPWSVQSAQAERAVPTSGKL